MPLESFLETVLRSLGSRFGASWGLFWASWGLLGPPAGVLGWKAWIFGSRSPSWASLGLSWAPLGPSWGPLGPSWRPLGLSWGALGGFLGRFGAVLEASRATLERRDDEKVITLQSCNNPPLEQDGGVPQERSKRRSSGLPRGNAPRTLQDGPNWPKSSQTRRPNLSKP